MKPFASDTLTALASGRLVTRDLLLFDLVSGLYGFWSGTGILTYNAIDYVGAGRLIQIEALEQNIDLSSSPLVARLSSVADSALTPDLLAGIEAETYHQRPVVLSRAYFDPDTRALISVERLFRGYIDHIDHEDKIGGGAELVCFLESKSRDHLKTGYRRRADTDQRRVNINDGGLRYAATAGSQTIFWGRLDPTPAAATGLPASR